MPNRITSWIQSLSPAWLGVVGVVVLSLFVGGSLFAYRTYDYIEHDNDFCISCHLMAEPYELFAESAHRDLGCKACHKPSFAGRSQMALTQVLESPDSIAVHAEVPNEKCVSCHIEGNPDDWILVASSAGHRVHMESDDPDLDGLLCVQCHSSSLHEFAATDQTCAQSGCHQDVEVRLGRMGDFTIHCAACHGFSAVVPEEAGVQVAQAALAPTGDECLSCHVMRTLVEMPEDEPHDQVCSACHNPHEQETPEQAVESCGTAACHGEVEELSPFHRGLDHLEVQDCSSCHAAHDWQADGEDCLSCHQDIYDDAPPPGGQVVARGGEEGGEGRGAGLRPVFAGLGGAFGAAGWVHDSEESSGPSLPEGFPRAQTPQDTLDVQAPGTSRLPFLAQQELVFRHGTHRDRACADCHDSSDRHGALTLETLTDCRSCHHTEPVSSECAACHGSADLASAAVVATGWPMDFSTGEAVLRDVAFDHGEHEGAACAQCHAEGPDQLGQVASCNDCHQEHHQPPEAVECTSCHETPDPGSHTVQSHLGCTGSGCHLDPPVPLAPRNRTGCLACHQELVDHRPGEECVECHALPEPRVGGAP